MADPDIYETENYGYDPSVPENIPLVPPPKPATPYTSRANVNPAWLPPVGYQTTPSCFVWATTYGLATFAAAKVNNLDPNDMANQASPIYTYIKVQELQGVASGTCSPGRILWCLDFMQLNGGTASMAAAPNEYYCGPAWTSWGAHTLSPNWMFQPMAWAGVELTGPEGLDNLYNLIALGIPIAYGCWLYTDFKTYAGSPVPYVGNGIWAVGANGSKVGHVMMIIGYDQNLGPNGSILIQNSFGPSWGGQWNGNGGYVWMDCNTFQTTAQCGGYYITLMQTEGKT